MTTFATLRPDLQIISKWVRKGSSVLDLGCGDGTLLEHLQDNRNCSGYGVELKRANVLKCVEAGINVIHSDIDGDGLGYFEPNSFDYVTMTLALQVSRRPDILLDRILEIGNEGIITFPNFGHWRSRLDIALGQMPVTKALPSSWYDTKNLHLCTLKDFEQLCADKGIRIVQRAAISAQMRKSIRAEVFPNLFGEMALYRITKK